MADDVTEDELAAVAAYEKARAALEENDTSARRTKYAETRDALAALRREHRLAEGRHDGTGVA